MATPLPPDDTALDAAAAALASGGLVVFPTETVYGVGANALDGAACARIFEAKGRPRFNPLIVHLADASELERVAIPHAAARALAARFWPGPLTLVLPKQPAVPDLVTAGLPTVGVRVPEHPVARALIARAGTPVAAPSANRFMQLSPTTVDAARSQLGAAVQAYVDGGPCRVGLESTIVGWIDGRATLLRPGGLDPRLIEEVVGPLARVQGSSGPILAPGMLARHYAPVTPLSLEHGAAGASPGVALLCLSATDADRRNYDAVTELSPRGDLAEAAARLFAAMRELDAAGHAAIVARLVPDEGLGLAINDRLRRAAARAE